MKDQKSPHVGLDSGRRDFLKIAGVSLATLVAASPTVAAEEEDEDQEGEDPAQFEVSIVSTNSPVVEGNTLEVTTQVENTGEEGATKTVELTIGDVERDAKAVELAGGESTTVTLSWQTEAGDAGDYAAKVESENDDDEEQVTITFKSPLEATENLAEKVRQLDLPDGTEKSLLAELEAAIELFERELTSAAVSELRAFINHVAAQRGNKIKEEDADDLIDEAELIIESVEPEAE